jgi:DNA-binding NarL/FixJ family response regulator
MIYQTQNRREGIKVLLADDQEIIREGFEQLLKLEKQEARISTAGNGLEALRLLSADQPDILITDIRMPEMDGVELCRTVSVTHPWIPVLAFSVFSDGPLILQMLEAGASGFLLKNARGEELVQAIHTVLSGEPYISKKAGIDLAGLIKNRVSGSKGTKQPLQYTEREIQIITHICEEKSNKEIAHLLNMNQRALESARERVFKKMGVKTTAGMIVHAIRIGLYRL